MSLNKILYNYMVNSLISEEYTVTLPDTKILDDFVRGVITKKKEEKHHMDDPYNEAKRWRTGMGGELALEILLGKKFADLTIGNSNDYHVPDLSALGLSVGIKTVELGKYPVIFKSSSKPEIIILKLEDGRPDALARSSATSRLNFSRLSDPSLPTAAPQVSVFVHLY